MGEPPDASLELTDHLVLIPAEAVDAPQAFSEALARRADWKAQGERERLAELAAGASRADRLPAATAFADYGSTGTGIDAASPTRTYGISVRVPLFDSGLRRAKIDESASLTRQERIRTRDLRDQIGLEVRLALDSLRSAQEQVAVAEEGLSLAEKELSQARRRYEVGVAGSLEVTDAQTRLSRARDNRVAALYEHNLARIALSEATGTIRQIAD
jgi:outer membrane protein TolC